MEQDSVREAIVKCASFNASLSECQLYTQNIADDCICRVSRFGSWSVFIYTVLLSGLIINEYYAFVGNIKITSGYLNWYKTHISVNLTNKLNVNHKDFNGYFWINIQCNFISCIKY